MGALGVVGKKIIFLALFSFSVSCFASADDGDIDHLSLAKILVKDRYYSRAEKVLTKIDFKDVDNKAIYKSLQGMILLSKKNYKNSIQAFQESLSLGLKEKEVYLYIAESQLQLGDYKNAARSLTKVDKEVRKKLPFYLVKAEVSWKQGNKKEAWNTLYKAESLGLSKNLILKKKFYYLLEESLFQTAKGLAFELLSDSNNFKDVVAMASQLRIKKQNYLSLLILQALQVQRPGNELVALEMAQNYLETNQKYSAALVLEKASKHNNSLNYEAAEILRQVGKSYRSKFINLTTLDPSQRLKQKLALYLEEEDYHSLEFLIPELQRTQLLENDDIRYAVAYSLFRVGAFKKSHKYLNAIKEDGLFEKSIELKKQIQECEQEKWSCSETI